MAEQASLKRGLTPIAKKDKPDAMLCIADWTFDECEAGGASTITKHGKVRMDNQGG